MTESFEIRENEILQSIIVLSDDDVFETDLRGQYCPYEMVIKTILPDGSTKTRQITGCHDLGPELKNHT